MRAEAAVFQDRPYLRPAQDLSSPAALSRLPQQQIARGIQRNGKATVPLGPLFVKRDSIECGIGADCRLRGVLGVLQLNQIALLEAAPQLVIGQPETRLTALLRQRFLDDHIELEQRSVVALEREAWFIRPRITVSP